MERTFFMKIKGYSYNKIESLMVHFQKLLYRGINYKWFNYPFGKKTIASKDKYIRLFKESSSKTFSDINNFEDKTGFSIDKNWVNDLALHTQITIKNSTLCYEHGKVLYSALSKYISDNQFDKSKEGLIIYETGTARGFSSLCMAKALEDRFASGKILTFDVLPHFTKMFWNCIDDHEGPKTRSELLLPWRNLVKNYIIFHQGNTRIELPKVMVERINFAFLDGSHTYDDVMFEFNQIRNKQFSGDMIVYDDYNQSQFPGLVSAVDDICEKYNYARTNLYSDTSRGYVVAKKI